VPIRAVADARALSVQAVGSPMGGWALVALGQNQLQLALAVGLTAVFLLMLRPHCAAARAGKAAAAGALVISEDGLSGPRAEQGVDAAEATTLHLELAAVEPTNGDMCLQVGPAQAPAAPPALWRGCYSRLACAGDEEDCRAAPGLCEESRRSRNGAPVARVPEGARASAGACAPGAALAAGRAGSLGLPGGVVAGGTGAAGPAAGVLDGGGACGKPPAPCEAEACSASGAQSHEPHEAVPREPQRRGPLGAAKAAACRVRAAEAPGAAETGAGEDSEVGSCAAEGPADASVVLTAEACKPGERPSGAAACGGGTHGAAPGAAGAAQGQEAGGVAGAQEYAYAYCEIEPAASEASAGASSGSGGGAAAAGGAGRHLRRFTRKVVASAAVFATFSGERPRRPAAPCAALRHRRRSLLVTCGGRRSCVHDRPSCPRCLLAVCWLYAPARGVHGQCGFLHLHGSAAAGLSRICSWLHISALPLVLGYHACAAWAQASWERWQACRGRR